MYRMPLAPAVCVLALYSLAPTQTVAQAGPYKVLQTAKVGGEGGFDYVTADSAARRLYVARSGAPPVGHVSVFDLDTLAPVAELPGVTAHGAAVDAASGHVFTSSKPIVMFDGKAVANPVVPMKTIEVRGNPDGLLADGGRIYVLSHAAPNVTVLNGVDGAIVGTIDLGGAPEQAAADGKGRLYIDIEDKDKIAVVDTKTLAVTTTYDLAPNGGTCAGLALDRVHNVLFATCRKPQTMVILDAGTGKILATLPIGAGTDGAVFNPATMEAFSSQGDGTLTIVKEASPTSFAVEQNLVTQPRAKTLTLDAKTNRILLIAAEFGVAPAAPAATAENPNPRPGRAPMVPGSFVILSVGK